MIAGTGGTPRRWLPRQDSNLGQRIQSPLCYHYTTGQRNGRDETLRLLERLTPAPNEVDQTTPDALLAPEPPAGAVDAGARGRMRVFEGFSFVHDKARGRPGRRAIRIPGTIISRRPSRRELRSLEAVDRRPGHVVAE